ncbi:MAG TPA: KH domain-containing protein [bacterium]|nr:KH domain-containing protein [bacterium]
MDRPQYQDFVEQLVKTLVDHPEKVSTERTVDERGVLLTLNIDPQDMGYVIGRGGQNARAIRTLLRLVGAKNNARVTLKINEPEGSQRPPRRERHVDTADVSVDDLKI